MHVEMEESPQHLKTTQKLALSVYTLIPLQNDHHESVHYSRLCFVRAVFLDTVLVSQLKMRGHSIL